ncbi:hypothetical protein A6V39_03735 [Candidatus Mycoplasma haematobovis]|uniref:Uncharacterized protein n=1 Tax=Candidatus Mycoplasma haematobovis TaxID=432608 RepID=A0A1A9QCN2_9MOLU|nr:hypothetical protein [Candidatus Mycoplasma haematobovis]OAL09998.1 hypothetical protein A6V39_03735 [Candidatus Mycoplasma haematobovis]
MISPKQALLGGLGVATIIGGGFGTSYLLQDKTIKDKLIRGGATIIELDDDYEIVFREFKGTESFINLVKTKVSTITNSSPDNVGGPALKQWCEEKLQLALTKENIDNNFANTKQYCSKTLFTIEDKMKKDKKQLATDWDAQFAKLKTPPQNTELQTDLSALNNAINAIDDQHKEAIKTALQTWCSSKIKTPLTKDISLWTKIDNRCLIAKVN